MQLRLLVLSSLLWCASCRGPSPSPSPSPSPNAGRNPSEVRHVSLGAAGASEGQGFAALRDAFVQNNPGYDLAYYGGVQELPPAACDRVVFVQDAFLAPTRAPTRGVPSDGDAGPVQCGDVLLLRAGQAWHTNREESVDLLAFSLPRPLPAELPPMVRPDWDPKITDTPGGCATEGDAYRRILLTWKPEVGPYILRQLNAHRVRIKDSFSHYHPKGSGFDEFYLVQQAPEVARLLTSERVAAIEARDVAPEEAQTLLQSRALRVGDLVYLPRGTMHRGLGGALVQVISVPGFVPKSEIGVDHHLWAINRKLGLKGGDAIPFHLVAARTAVVK